MLARELQGRPEATPHHVHFINHEVPHPMHVTVSFDGKMPIVGLNEKKHKTRFDASLEVTEPAKYASPMEVVLESLAACSLMDIIIILKKKKKRLVTIDVELDADRAEEAPKVFTAIRIGYRLRSPDCSLVEFEKAITLSLDKYCSVAAMLRSSGCAVTWNASLEDAKRRKRS
jgi:putative redox protein